MKRLSRHVVVFVLAAFFALGILCSTFAAPGQAVASVSGCSQTPGAMSMAGCEQPVYLCGFDSATTLTSRGSLTVQSSDLLKEALGLALGAASVDASVDPASSPGAGNGKKTSFARLPTVAIYLFNSVLTL
jgi:hypothetical protein